MQALLVYLDSSDFSNLSNPPREKIEEIKKVKEKLKTWIDSGKIEIRYSLAHIMEALPINKDMTEPGERRLLCITELCGKKVLKDPLSIITNELSGLDNTDIKNNKGHWLPDIEKIWSSEIPKDDEPKKNRQQRREQKAKTRKAIKTDDSLTKELTQEYPVKKSLSLDFFSDPDKTTSFTKVLRDSTADLQFLSRWYLKNWNKSTQFSNAVRSAGKELKELFTSSASELKVLHKELTDAGESENEINKQVTALAKDLANKAPQDIVDALSETPIPPEQKVIASFQATPSTYIFSKFVGEIFLSSVASLKNTRKAKDSDFGDLIHSLYVPYVDFFRADLSTASALKNIQAEYRATITTSLQDLIDKIEATLKSKETKITSK